MDLEPLKPYFSALASLDLKSRKEVAEWIGKNIEADAQRNPQGLRMAPADVMLSRKADRMNRDIFFVALCRANGLEARLDPLTGQAEADLYEKAALESGETPTLIEDGE